MATPEQVFANKQLSEFVAQKVAGRLRDDYLLHLWVHEYAYRIPFVDLANSVRKEFPQLKESGFNARIKELVEKHTKTSSSFFNDGILAVEGEIEFLVCGDDDVRKLRSMSINELGQLLGENVAAGFMRLANCDVVVYSEWVITRKVAGWQFIN